MSPKDRDGARNLARLIIEHKQASWSETETVLAAYSIMAALDRIEACESKLAIVERSLQLLSERIS